MGGLGEGLGTLSARQPTLKELTDGSTAKRYYANAVMAEQAAASVPPPPTLPSLYRRTRDHPLRTKNRNNHSVDDDPGVMLLEEKIIQLEVRRAKKQNDLDVKNGMLIERDRLRQEWYKREFKSAEQLEEIRLEELQIELQLHIDQLCAEEEVGRAYEEEEESLEYRNELYMLHLSIFSTTVAIVTAESERKQNQLKLIEEEEQRRADTHQKIVELFVKETYDDKRDFERAEHNDRKVLAQQFQSAQVMMQTAIQTQKQVDIQTIEKKRELEVEKREQEKLLELLEVERQLEERIKRLDERCKLTK
eukprot:GILI01009495.1.p1 GENE.GILI01009495.1~~GILI01009495.1.p1  ORF type:complete len:326 (-),score=79.16 GILI01009495.1:185-1102(-)